MGVTLLLNAAADIWSEDEVKGQILRLRAYGDDEGPKRYYVAVDDGSASAVRAWVVDPDLYAGLRQDQVVTSRVTRRLRHVRSITPEA